ncbi:MAG TPA: TolC family protein, partial [Caulobacteraceae bacterium]|nr:TolC family protein [Caulobacteraceae bacterium]
MPRRACLAAGLAVSTLAIAALGPVSGAQAMSLPEAIALAQKNNPTLAQARAEADAAEARLGQARAARLPSVTVAGGAAAGTNDLGGFFGFGRNDVHPRQLALELRQPLFAGGALAAGVDRARAGRDAAQLQVGGARAMLSAEVAEAYVGVLSAREVARLNEAQVRQMQAIADQAQLRFKAGEVPRTDVAQAQARLAEARAGQARADGDAARADSRFQL